MWGLSGFLWKQSQIPLFSSWLYAVCFCVFWELRRAWEDADMWCGNHVVTHNSDDKQSSKDAAAESSVTVPSCAMISALVFAFPDRWDDDGKIVFMACSAKLKQVSTHIYLTASTWSWALGDWFWISFYGDGTLLNIAVACNKVLCSGFGTSVVDCHLKV